MKRAKFVVPVLMLLALGFVLAGCPKSDKMMQNESPASTVEHIG